jgi:hypothetical protein
MVKVSNYCMYQKKSYSRINIKHVPNGTQIFKNLHHIPHHRKTLERKSCWFLHNFNFFCINWLKHDSVSNFQKLISKNIEKD